METGDCIWLQNITAISEGLFEYKAKSKGTL